MYLEKNRSFIGGACAWLCCTVAPLAAQTDIVVSDFEFPAWKDAGWTVEGTAFGAGPATGALGRQMPTDGYQGKGLVNSFLGGSDKPTGTLSSPTFVIRQPYLNFLIGGGGHPGTRLELWVDGKPVRSASGDNTQRGGSERLSAKTFDVSEFSGKTAALKIIDAETGGWGHITVDQIVLSEKPAGPIVNATNDPGLAQKNIVDRIRQNVRVQVDKDSPYYPAAYAEAERLVGRENMTPQDRQRAVLELRKALWADPLRPTYHLLPPEGLWNDVNGALYWKGRYHLFFLGREAPDVPAILSGKETAYAREVWLHASSADLTHWIWHPPALNFPRDGSMPRGVYSGGAVAGTDVPTLIYHVPTQGTCVARAKDDKLIEWMPNPANPVISEKGQNPDVVVFDPAAWKEGDTYYTLVGNKSRRPGYEGDSTSLFKSKDLVHWEYLHPLYKSDRRWTSEDEDAACPDFFPIGNGRHMLITHIHGPMYGTQYYIGTWKDEVFTPESHGRMSWAGGCMSGPESLRDGQGRRILWGWLRENKPMRNGWSSVLSMPRVLTLAPDNTLRIAPPEEMKALRAQAYTLSAIPLRDGENVPLKEISGNTLEISLVVDPQSAKDVYVDVLRSPGAEEFTRIVYSPKEKTLAVDVTHASLDPSVRYIAYVPRYADRKGIPESDRTVTRQSAPLDLPAGESLRLRIFIDRSVLEVFANDRQCVTQRIYPTRPDSLGVAVGAEGGNARVLECNAWEISPTNPW